jgi:predicted methyltransferase
MSAMRELVLAGIVLILTAFPLLAQEAPVKPRVPAPVMTFHGADWLERPEREQEERPAEVIAAMGLKPGDMVGDIGAGSGFFSRRMAKAVAPGGKVHAVEIQPEMLAKLEELAKRDGVDNIVPVLGTETDPKLPAGSLDWLILVDVYHEFQQPAPMLAKMLESLKPGGRVALIEYRLLGDTARHIREEHRMSVEQVRSEWEPAGFHLVEVLEFLPSQHLFIFEKPADSAKGAPVVEPPAH